MNERCFTIGTTIAPTTKGTRERRLDTWSAEATPVPSAVGTSARRGSWLPHSSCCLQRQGNSTGAWTNSALLHYQASATVPLPELLDFVQDPPELDVGHAIREKQPHDAIAYQRHERLVPQRQDEHLSALARKELS